MTVSAPWFIALNYERGPWCHYPRVKPMSKPTNTAIKVSKRTHDKLSARAARAAAFITAALETIGSRHSDLV